jgi:hypothetical protein
MNPLSVPHQVTRLIFDVGQPYEKFRSRYEAAVPVLDPQWLGEYTGRHVRWHDTIADSDEPSPHGFVLYWRGHLTPLMTEGGELRPCTAYLMGLPDIQEQAYRQDPAVMLHMPLRTLIYIDGDDRTRFGVDQPSTLLASFADPAIAAVGLDLDRRLADLLGALGVKASPALAASQAQVPTPRLGQRSSAGRRAGRPQT